MSIADPTIVDDLKQAYETILFYAANHTSPQHDEFICQLLLADSIRNRGKVATIKDRPTDLRNILFPAGLTLSPAGIAGLVTDLEASLNQTSRRKRAIENIGTAHTRVLMEALETGARQITGQFPTQTVEARDDAQSPNAAV